MTIRVRYSGASGDFIKGDRNAARRIDLAAITTPQPWMTDAVCATVDPDLWYPERGDGYSSRWAKRVCRACPVIAECLAYALDQGEEYGIWGGTSANERRVLAGKNPRGDFREVGSCGSLAGYRTHHRAGETPCQPCLDARAEHEAARRARSRGIA